MHSHELITLIALFRLVLNWTYLDISNFFGVSTSVAYRAAKKISNPRYALPIGRPRSLTFDDFKLIEQIMDSEPDLYLDEILGLFERLAEKRISIMTLCRGINYIKITRKKATNIAREARLSDQVRYIQVNWTKEICAIKNWNSGSTLSLS